MNGVPDRRFGGRVYLELVRPLVSKSAVEHIRFIGTYRYRARRYEINHGKRPECTGETSTLGNNAHVK